VALEFIADAALAAVLAGQPARAVSLADELLERPAPHRARQSAEIHRVRALILLGQFDEADRALTSLADQVSPDYFGLGEARTRAAELALWSGRPGQAVELAESALAIPAPLPVGHVSPSLVRAWGRWELGRDPGPALPIGLTPSLAGALPELDALARLHAGDHAGAVERFDAAVAAWGGYDRTRALVCAWGAGESSRRAGYREAAVERLHATLARTAEIGFEPLASRIRRSLRLAGVRITAVERSTARVGAELTARERELVVLVERGLTNTEIARRLGLGRPTVARTLASAMAKLGVDRRAQLAALERV
jgi:DNA-binding CsgD family transcriptional regulator